VWHRGHPRTRSCRSGDARWRHDVKKLAKKFAGIQKVFTFASPFGNGGTQSSFKRFWVAKIFEIIFKKFADSKKVTTFAIPIAREGLAISRRGWFF
jgi:hypothetical protein